MRWITSKRTIAFIVAGLLILAAAGAYIAMRQADSLKSVGGVKSAVGRHYVLPTNEEPALLTIIDKSKVSSAFLSKAQNGDKVLVYKNNKKAILYRPSVDRIIDVGEVVIDDVRAKSSN